MTGSIGPLMGADEHFNHQTVETFASVAHSDLAWAEKVCGMAAAKDGSLQIGFGFGKYTNRNVVDAYAGICRGTEQWTVRASRSLNADPETVNVGPIRYEIIEPLNSVRITLEANEAQPIAFDIVFTAVVPCVVEEREDRRDMHGYRKATDQIRYHQTGMVTGWLEIEGERTVIERSEWVSTRDKSWGIRPSVGAPLTDLEPDMHQLIPQVLAIWNPILFERPDGTAYAFHHYYLLFRAPGYDHHKIQGGFETESGKSLAVASMTPDMNFESPSKRLQSGVFNFIMEDGSERPLQFEKISETGFYLGAGHYHGGDGQYHGSWRGELVVDGVYEKNAAEPAVLERFTQFRDCLIRVQDPVGGGVGWGNCQTYIHGAWPEFGLSGSEPML